MMYESPASYGEEAETGSGTKRLGRYTSTLKDDESTATMRSTQHTRRGSGASVAGNEYNFLPAEGGLGTSRLLIPPSEQKAQEQQQEEEDKLLGELESIQVLVRVRPLLTAERNREVHSVVECSPEGGNFVSVRAGARRSIRCKYDHVLGPTARQVDVYRQVQDCAQRTLEGYNATIMAYGQTGSGKTHTMFGPQGYTAELFKKGGRLPESVGIIPRAIADLFASIRKRGADEAEAVTVYCSFVQIYNEQLFDMLRDGGRDNPLIIHEDSKNREIFVQGLSEFMVKSGEECLTLLRVGEENRAIRETHMNMASSRSHSIFTLVVEQRKKDEATGLVRHLRSKLNLVDLAGSEKWDTRQDLNSQHALELTNINYSLFTLGRCVAALTSKGGAHVPYRDSKLTRLIQDSLGGNTRTRILATLSPTLDCVEETVSTLKFADRAKQVLVYVRESEKVGVDEVLMERLQKEVAQLRAMIVRLKDNQANGSTLMVQPTGSRKAMGVRELVERYEALEDELRREKTERERLQKQNDELKQQLLSGGGSRATSPRGSVASLLAGSEAGGSSRHSSVAQVVLPPLVDAAERAGEEKAGPAESNQEDVVPLVKYEEARQRLQEAEAVRDLMRGLLRRFFAFEIEEAELRKQLEPHVPNIDAILASPRPQQQNQHHHHQVLPPLSSAKRQQQAGGPQDDDEDDDDEDEEDGEKQHQHHEEQPAQGSEDPLQVLLLPKLHAEGVPSVTYRIRGPRTTDPSGQGQGPASIDEFRSVSYVKEDEEEKLIQQLKEARRRMRKHMKLQEWLLTKEQRELEAAEREEAARQAEEEAQKLKDAKFRERAAKQKKKLEQYYAALRDKATAELYGEQQQPEQPQAQHVPGGSTITSTAGSSGAMWRTASSDAPPPALSITVSGRNGSADATAGMMMMSSQRSSTSSASSSSPVLTDTHQTILEASKRLSQTSTRSGSQQLSSPQAATLTGRHDDADEIVIHPPPTLAQELDLRGQPH